MTPVTLAIVATFAPAIAALLLLVVFPLRHKGAPAAWICLLGSVVSLGAALKLLVDRLGGAGDTRFTTPWIMENGRAMAEMGVLIDGVSLPMLVIVGVVALCVQLFSVAYMHDEEPRAFGRYFTLHALFLFSMNVVVIAPNLLQLFAGWELVGLTSYLLIGFYFAKPSAAKAAVKAFWMTKLADMGFLFGLLILYVNTGGFEWTAQASTFVATWVTAMLFLAVVGKSAQFPLHIWLPDAMEGPTPVSALLHAATMVAAGVFLVVRADPLFALAPGTREVMLWIGSITALFAACLALVQSDIKKVLAYSTASQLGYMVAALGAGNAFAGFFHLGTHAFFKALLFLAAGSVIHAVHSNSLSDMGGLRKKLPLTTAAFGIGALSLAGFPGFAGFFSKDLVLSSLEGKANWIPWTMLMASAFLTAFYMGRVLIKAFGGELSEKGAHAHEGGAAMTGPLVILAIPALLSGFLGGWIGTQMHHEHELHFLALTPVVASSMSLIGLVAAWFVFRNGGKAPTAVLERLDAFSLVDKTWATAYSVGLLGVSSIAGWVDRYLVDGLMNFSAWGTLEGGESARKLQTGRVRDYALMVVAGIVVLALIGVLR